MKLLIFAGTYEGRLLAEALAGAGIEADVCTATAYGAEKLVGLDTIRLHTGRMTVKDIEAFIRRNSFDTVIDATHPYAREVTENIKKASKKTGINYIRLLRKENTYENVVADTKAAVEALKSTKGNVLVTTGSKELHLYTALTDYRKRLYIRVLPAPEVISRCHELGFPTDHIIAMQGPFSKDMNLAMLNMYKCHTLVTKNTGEAGGLDEKFAAAAEAEAEVILIDRPVKETGLSLQEVLSLLGIEERERKKEFFPLFVSSKGKKALVVGGGKVAARRVKTLLMFQYEVSVVAPDISEEIKNLGVHLIYDKFEPEYLEGFDLITAATNSREVNRLVGEHAKVPVSIADSMEESSFYFPAVIVTNELVAGVTSEGHSHVAVRQAAARVREALS